MDQFKQFLLLIFSISFFSFSSDKIESLIPSTFSIDDKTLILNGNGTRTFLSIKIYAAGLYLIKNKNDAHDIIEANEAMSIKLIVTSGLITSEKLSKTTRKGFIKSTNGNTIPIQDKIDLFIDAFKEKIHKQDMFDITYNPDTGISIYKNKRKLKTISGLEFKKAVFGIWLCDKPAQKKLKQELLGV